MSADHQIPRTRWSEDKKNLYITIELSNIQHPKVDIQKDRVVFEGQSNGQTYGIDLKLKGEVIPEESSYAIKGPAVEILLKKKDEGRWNQLTEDKNAYKQQLHIDWDKWIDEDEEDKPLAGGMGDFGMGGMPGGMGGMGGGAGGMDFASMMQGMGGAGGGGGGAGGFDPSQFGDMGAGEDEQDSDDEDLPDLETTDETTKAGESSTATDKASTAASEEKSATEEQKA